VEPTHNEVWYNASMDKVCADRACQDLLIWACLCNHPSIAKYFWRQGGNSIAVALTAVTLLRRLAMYPHLNARGSFRKVGSELLALAAEFEQFAMGTLRVCNAEGPRKVRTPCVSA
jgi:hypothetical protein